MALELPCLGFECVLDPLSLLDRVRERAFPSLRINCLAPAPNAPSCSTYEWHAFQAHGIVIFHSLEAESWGQGEITGTGDFSRAGITPPP